MFFQQPPRQPVALGGLMAALAVVFGLAAQLLPFFFGLLAPLPLALAALLMPAQMAGASALAASLVLGMILGPLNGAGFFLGTALWGFIIGVLVGRGKSYGLLFAVATAVKVIGTLLELLLSLFLSGAGLSYFTNFADELEAEMLAAAEETNFYSVMSTSGLDAAQAKQLFSAMVQTLAQLTPALYVLLFALMSAAVLLLLHLLCRRLQLQTQVQPPSWGEILMPPWVLVPFLAAWVLLLVERHFDNQVLWIVCANVMVIGAACMALDGFSYCLAKLKFREKSPAAQLLYLLLALLVGWYLLVVLAVIGTFDSIADYRRLRLRKGD